MLLLVLSTTLPISHLFKVRILLHFCPRECARNTNLPSNHSHYLLCNFCEWLMNRSPWCFSFLRFYFGQCVQHYFQNIFHFFVFPTLVLSYLDVTFLSRPCRDAPPGRASLRFRITKFSFFSRLLYFIPIRTIKTNQKNQHEFYLFPAKPEQHKTVSSCVTSRRIPTYAANALVEMGDSLKQMADVKYSLDDNIKQNFLEPLHQLQTKDLKEVMVSRTRIVLFCNVFVARTSKAQQNNVNEPMSKCQQ